MMIKKVLIIFVVLFVAVFLVLRIKKEKKEEEIFKEVIPRRGNISLTIETNGVVNPRNRLEIKPPVAGRIEKILVKEGEKIKKGSTLAWMSSSERAALLDTARAKGESELKKWETVYKPTPIIAPLTGFIIKRNVEPGQSVSLSDVILVMADELIVKAQVDETDVGKLKKGQIATITLDAYPDIQISGEIEHIAYESEIINNVTIYEVDIKPNEKIGLLRSGMSADIRIVIDEKKNVLLLPSYTVKKTPRGTFVFIKKFGQKKPERRKIKTGIDNGEFVEVLNGIDENDIILVIPEYQGENRFPRFGLPGMSNKKQKASNSKR